MSVNVSSSLPQGLSNALNAFSRCTKQTLKITPQNGSSFRDGGIVSFMLPAGVVLDLWSLVAVFGFTTVNAVGAGCAAANMPAFYGSSILKKVEVICNGSNALGANGVSDYGYVWNQVVKNPVDAGVAGRASAAVAECVGHVCTAAANEVNSSQHIANRWAGTILANKSMRYMATGAFGHRPGHGFLYPDVSTSQGQGMM